MPQDDRTRAESTQTGCLIADIILRLLVFKLCAHLRVTFTRFCRIAMLKTQAQRRESEAAKGWVCFSTSVHEQRANSDRAGRSTIG